MDDTTLTREELDAGWREMKYLVGFNSATKTYAVGYTITWHLHDSIPAEWEPGYKPVSGGRFKAKLGDRSQGMKWDLDTLSIFGRSLGYNFAPVEPRDTTLVKKMLQGENDRNYIREFTETFEVLA